MKMVPDTKQSLVLRTDFSNDAVWESLCAAIQEPVGEFRAYVDFINDREFEGVTSDTLLQLISKNSFRRFVFIVDKEAISNPEHPILIVDLCDEPGRTFRVIPSATWNVENNLSIGNMDFFEFAGAADEDGILRGFRE